MPISKNKSKTFFLPVNTGFSKNQTPDSRCIEFYRERSGNGLHCAIVGNVVLPSGVGSNNACSKISKNVAWNALTEAISERGAIPGVQLASCWPGYKGMQNFITKSNKKNINTYREIASSLKEKDIIDAFDDLKLGTSLAASAGFGHIQLHAAHGYLFNLIIDSRFSRHVDLAMEKLTEWSDQTADLEVEASIRLSLATGATEIDDYEPNDFLDKICTLPIDYIDISSGFYNLNKRLIYPSTDKLLSQRIAATTGLAHGHPRRNFIASGKSLKGWTKDLPKNVHIGICRDLIANPEFLKKHSNGCQNRMKCHYHSRGKDSITCGKWDTYNQ
ncbi:hypothetical protein [Halomonas sp. YLGW01]|uniref:oxidoreductase n=1 Tax=Halomonas sp. YLGW01 TaxID=2773308 RepID=UPI001781E41C|nr:hypothetical protein [Halomonas sp. YLGW01]